MREGHIGTVGRSNERARAVASADGAGALDFLEVALLGWGWGMAGRAREGPRSSERS
jgi:hypothetical protein